MMIYLILCSLILSYWFPHYSVHISSDGSEGNEKRFCYSFASDDGSSLFRTSNDLMLSILIYLDIGVESVCHVDVAVTNTAERVIWLTILSANYFVMFSEHEHCEESMWHTLSISKWLRINNIKSLLALNKDDPSSEAKREHNLFSFPSDPSVAIIMSRDTLSSTIYVVLDRSADFDTWNNGCVVLLPTFGLCWNLAECVHSRCSLLLL